MLSRDPLKPRSVGRYLLLTAVVGTALVAILPRLGTVGWAAGSPESEASRQLLERLEMGQALLNDSLLGPGRRSSDLMMISSDRGPLPNDGSQRPVAAWPEAAPSGPRPPEAATDVHLVVRSPSAKVLFALRPDLNDSMLALSHVADPWFDWNGIVNIVQGGLEGSVADHMPSPEAIRDHIVERHSVTLARMLAFRTGSERLRLSTWGKV